MALSKADSLRTAVAVNIAKLTLLAALAPPVIAGIAQRASILGDGLDTAALVATTASIGSVSAVIGALLGGFLADTGSASALSRWGLSVVATLVGTAGLIALSLSETRATLFVGWTLAQLGYSAAMAVLRLLLADALPKHRRRGAVVSVLGSYGGLVLPLALLLLFPTRVWETTFGLALLSLAVPAAMVMLFRNQKSVAAGAVHEISEMGADEKSASLRPLSWPWLLLIQFAANIVLTIFLSYHPLELAQRAGTGVPAQSTVIVIACAVCGILLSTGVLLWKPVLLSENTRIISLAGVVLGASLVIRALVEPFWLISFAALLSGLAVGLNSSALFATALEHVRKKHGGKWMGTYSAAGAAGQVAGPMIALVILFLTTQEQASFEVVPGYRALFFALALLPLGWAIATALFLVMPRRVV